MRGIVAVGAHRANWRRHRSAAQRSSTLALALASQYVCRRVPDMGVVGSDCMEVMGSHSMHGMGDIRSRRIGLIWSSSMSAIDEPFQ